jgi:hypothetical protein
MPSIEDLVSRLENLLKQARDMTATITEQFGGQALGPDDWHQLVSKAPKRVLTRRCRPGTLAGAMYGPA